jgi:hypothetical protein
MAAFNSTTTTTTKNKAYIREDRQGRQGRQQGDDKRRDDEEIEGRQVSANGDHQDRQGRQAVDKMITQTPASFLAGPGEDITVAKPQARRDQEQNDDWLEI